MNGSMTSRKPADKPVIQRENFLLDSGRYMDAGSSFENLESLEKLIGSNGLKHEKALEDFSNSTARVKEWRERLHESRSKGLGFAAPGGFFTRSLYEAILLKNLDGAEIIQSLKGRPLVELGAGCLHYGWMIASACYSSSYIGIEPYYADKLAISIQSAEEKYRDIYPIPESTVIPRDMKLALENLPDSSACILACGIEDCILPGMAYRESVEEQISRILPPDGIFISFQSDLHLKGINRTVTSIKRVDSPHKDRLCIYRR